VDCGNGGLTGKGERGKEEIGIGATLPMDLYERRISGLS
jgi:hypothetical protein